MTKMYFVDFMYNGRFPEQCNSIWSAVLLRFYRYICTSQRSKTALPSQFYSHYVDDKVYVYETVCMYAFYVWLINEKNRALWVSHQHIVRLDLQSISAWCEILVHCRNGMHFVWVPKLGISLLHIMSVPWQYVIQVTYTRKICYYYSFIWSLLKTVYCMLT